jgi:putative ABC transport system ATP-binding protein
MAILECRRVSKSFGTGRARQLVLDDVSLSFDRAQLCALLGPSGSGKTTLLSILGCLLSPSSGDLTIQGSPVSFRQPGELVRLRRSTIGFVFQHSQLLPFLTIEENLLIVARNLGLDRRERRRRASELLDELGLTHIRGRPPDEASGGERQRVAVARAVLNRPPIVLADEPTASLDWVNGQRVMELLVRLATEARSLLLVVSHDPRILPFVERVIRVDSGKVGEE